MKYTNIVTLAVFVVCFARPKFIDKTYPSINFTIKTSAYLTLSTSQRPFPNRLHLHVCNGSCDCQNYDEECVITKFTYKMVSVTIKDAADNSETTDEHEIPDPTECVCCLPQHCVPAEEDIVHSTMKESSSTDTTEDPSVPFNTSVPTGPTGPPEPLVPSGPSAQLDPLLTVLSIVCLVVTVLFFILWCLGCLTIQCPPRINICARFHKYIWNRRLPTPGVGKLSSEKSRDVVETINVSYDREF